jgi:hypothetical protein
MHESVEPAEIDLASIGGVVHEPHQVTVTCIATPGGGRRLLSLRNDEGVSNPRRPRFRKRPHHSDAPDRLTEDRG